jgi:hypothetical protein
MTCNTQAPLKWKDEWYYKTALIDGETGVLTFPPVIMLSVNVAKDVVQGARISHHSDVIALMINMGDDPGSFRLSVWFRNDSTVFVPDLHPDKVCEVLVCHHAYITIMLVGGEYVVTFTKEFGHGYINDVIDFDAELSIDQREDVFNVFMDSISNDGVPDQTQLRKFAKWRRWMPKEDRHQHLIGCVEAFQNVREPVLYKASSKLSDGPYRSAALERYLRKPRKERMQDRLQPRLGASSGLSRG